MSSAFIRGYRLIIKKLEMDARQDRIHYKGWFLEVLRTDEIELGNVQKCVLRKKFQMARRKALFQFEL